MNQYENIKKIAVLSAQLLEEVQFDSCTKKSTEEKITNLCWACLQASQNPFAIMDKITNDLNSEKQSQ